ncbi:MAG: peptide chain release factor N(5)-glutamine methyltransferase [bacterium]|nr:peptide chain release factor N(5)-glutamine methyltransferase [bacterium]
MLNKETPKGRDYSQDIRWLLEEKYHGQMSEAAQTDIERIKQGEPVAYVIGFVDFLGCKIDLSQKTLIPRAETEFWVEQAIRSIKKDVPTGVRCLDMFAGSGCIGVAVLKNIPFSTVDFVDCDATAITQIAINCKLNGIEASRWKVIKSDGFQRVDDSYDYIFANPPYIAKNRRSDVAESVLTHEPRGALWGGTDGLLYIKTFLDQVKEYLNEGGTVYMEFDTHQKDEIEKILMTKSFNKIDFCQDQFGKWRYLVLIA